MCLETVLYLYVNYNSLDYLENNKKDLCVCVSIIMAL